MPWASAGAPAYEDWYLVRSSADLDPLNDAAVTASRQQPHDAAAIAASGGVAGLYRLRLGHPEATPAFSWWFAKPTGTTYAQLYDLLQPVVDQSGAVLWGRQMTLGPAREFCLQAPARVSLPASLEALEVPLGTVWPPGA